jgi:chromate transport protein ChrA
MIAIVRSVGGSPALAQVVSLVVGVALLVLMVRAARDEKASVRDRDRRALTFSLAAALVLTPVVWPHYLVLLLAPVALARPRLSPMWLVVLAATVLYAFDWYRASPEGEWRPVLTIACIVTGVFVASLRRGEPQIDAK